MSMERYYLDTNALYAFYRDGMRTLQRKHPHYQAMTGGEKVRELSETAQVYVSELTYVEFIGRITRHSRTPIGVASNKPTPAFNESEINALLQALHQVQGLSETAQAHISALTGDEFLKCMMSHSRKHSKSSNKMELRKLEMDTILEALRKDIGHSARHRFQLVPVAEDAYRYARELMLNHARGKGACGLDTNDALHIATAKMLQPPVTLVTSDGGKSRGLNTAKMKCACDCINLKYFDPELDDIETVPDNFL
ncbi:PIN domain-containing protein [Candidatus Venteria ishoeyi]|uniref:PIN domain-containing protein n=1 Tax=Candidatus Venteria ishoeyi TaxID=1899563 RepID=UPI0025A546F8|nr:PIN domain-containing protein [Candidatus Venteria ishoeyi]MDM8547580.1 PIN domain-containing protein [Candidatus Venteria ishoeyi]